MTIDDKAREAQYTVRATHDYTRMTYRMFPLKTPEIIRQMQNKMYYEEQQERIRYIRKNGE